MPPFDAHIQRLARYVSFRNVGLMAVAVALLYLMFFDNDSVWFQWKLSREIKALRAENRELSRKIKQNKELLKHFDDPAYVEKYAREQLLFRKANEEIFLVEMPDSLKQDGR